MEHEVDRESMAAEMLHLKNLQRLHQGLAHDLRSPFNAIFLQLELLKLMADRAGAGGGSNRQLKGLGRVEKELTLLRTSVEALISQLAPGSQAELHDLSKLVRDCGELISHEAASEKIQIRTKAEDPVEITGRLDLLRTLVLSLVLQAMDVVGRDGRLRLDARLVEGRARFELNAAFGPDAVAKHSTAPRPYVDAEIAEALGGSLESSRHEGEDEGFAWSVAFPPARAE